MERATPGCRVMRPAFSSDSTPLMDRRRGDLEEALHIGLCGRPAEQALIGVDEGEILALLGGEAGSRISGGSIHHCPQQWGISDECKIPGRVEPDGA